MKTIEDRLRELEERVRDLEVARMEDNAEPRRQRAMDAPTLEQATSYGDQLMIRPAAVEFWWQRREATGWHKSSANGHPMPVHNWQADLAASRTWATEGAKNNARATNGIAPGQPARSAPKSPQPRQGEVSSAEAQEILGDLLA